MKLPSPTAPLTIPHSHSKKSNSNNNSLNPIRKYHSFHTGVDQSSSLNALKFLIKSKIRLPQALTHSHPLHTVAMTEKIKIKYDKSQQFSSTSEFKTLLESIKDISYELDLKHLSEKIISNVKLLAHAEKASLFFVCHNKQQLATFKFDPHTGIKNSAKYFAKNSQAYSHSGAIDFELEIPFENTILGTVANTGMPINVTNVTKVYATIQKARV